MDISERNKKVALARWKNKHLEEMKRIKNTTQNILLKSSICGFLAGDGSVQKRKEKNFYHHQIDFFPDDLVMLNAYVDAIKKVYSKKPTLREHNNYYSVRMSSKVIVEDLLKIAEFGQKQWTVPSSLFDIDGAKEMWLKSFFSGEAYVSKKSIKVQTVNKKGMLQVAKLLHELGIKTRQYEYEPKKKNHSKVYILFINQKADKEKYYNKIGFWHEKKAKKLKESLGL